MSESQLTREPIRRRFTYNRRPLPSGEIFFNRARSMPDIKLNSKANRKRLSLNWTQLHAITEGISAIDLGSLLIRNRDDADRFVKEYGFELESEKDWDRATRAHREAIEFIDEYFLSPSQRALVDPDVRHPKNLLDLLVYASNYLNKSLKKQRWSCAVLKVMHGIFHIDLDFKLKNFDEIRRQIFVPLDTMIQSNGANHYLTDGTMSLPLYFLQKKRNKNRKSILLKLLQKPNYVASDIYDHLGLRLILNTKVECLLALKLLSRNHQISITNIKPFRSKNNLIDLKMAKRVFTKLKPAMLATESYPTDIFQKMDEELAREFLAQPRKDNPHSSSDFHSIQVTIRKMIRIPNPAYETIKRYQKAFQGIRLEPPAPLDVTPIDPEIAFYFDYEIQLLDKASYLRSMRGPSSHAAYKKRQRETARRRVLGKELIDFLDLHPD